MEENNKSYLDSELLLRKVSRPLLRLLQHLCALVLRQASSNGAGLLGSEIEGKVLLLGVEETELCALISVDDCEDLCD